MTLKEQEKKASKTARMRASTIIPPDIIFNQILRKAKEKFYQMSPFNVIGVDINEIRENGQVKKGEFGICVYVQQKLPESSLDAAEILPRELEALPVDVIEAFLPDSPKTAVDYMKDHHHLIHDMSNIDWARLHEISMFTEAPVIEHAVKVQDFGDVCVIEDDDNTLTKTASNGQQYTDFVRVE